MNDLEKKLRKRGMKKLDKFAHNPYHVNKPSFFSRIPLWGKIAVPASLVTAVTVVAFFGIINNAGGLGYANKAPASNNKGEASTSAIDKAGSESQADVTSLDPGASTAAYNRYSSLAYNGLEYSFMAAGSDKSGSGYTGEQSSTPQLGNLLSETTNQETGEVISIYQIKDYSSDVFVAAKFSSEPTTYVCYNSESTFATIGDLFNDIPFLRDFIAVENVKEYNSSSEPTVYRGVSGATVNSYLFDGLDTNIPNVANTFTSEASENYIEMNLISKPFNDICSTVRMYDTGHFAIRIDKDFGTSYLNVYEIGVERYNTLLNYTHTLVIRN